MIIGIIIDLLYSPWFGMVSLLIGKVDHKMYHVSNVGKYFRMRLEKGPKLTQILEESSFLFFWKRCSSVAEYYRIHKNKEMALSITKQ